MCHSRESGNPWTELSVKWFAQRHEGIKRLLRVFVYSCEPKAYRARKYRAMCSRFRGNDNFGVLGSVDENSRRSSVGWGLSRLSIKRSVIRQGAIGSSLRWSDVVAYCDAALRPSRLCVNPIICHSEENGNPWTELSAKWFAQRREGIKRLLPVFVSSCELKTRHTRKYRAMGSRFRGNDNFGVLGRVNGYSRRPSAGWGLSRLSAKHSAIRTGAIGSSLRWSDVVAYCDAALRPPRLCVHLFL